MYSLPKLATFCVVCYFIVNSCMVTRNLADCALVTDCECKVKDTVPFIHEIARQQHAGKVSNKITINGESCECRTQDGEKDQINIENLYEG